MDVEQEFQQVVVLAQKGDYDGALSVVLSILRAEPEHGRALVFRYTLEARLFQRSGQDHDAIKRYQAVLAMDPANREATSMLEKYAASGVGRPRPRAGANAQPTRTTGPVARRERPANDATKAAPAAVRNQNTAEPETEIEVSPIRQRPPSRPGQPAVSGRPPAARQVEATEVSFSAPPRHAHGPAASAAGAPSPAVSRPPAQVFISAAPAPQAVSAPPEPAFVSSHSEPVFVSAPPEFVSAPPLASGAARAPNRDIVSLEPGPMPENMFPDADPAPLSPPPSRPPQVSSRPPRKSSRPPGDERRRAPRAALSVEVGLHSDTNFYTGFTGDISEGGLFVATYNLLPIGSLVHVSFGLPGGIEIEADAEVRWVRDPHDINEQPGLGVRFTRLSQSNAEAIHHFMDLRAPIFFDDEG